MKTITNGYIQSETIPLPCQRNKKGVLYYDPEFANELVSNAYGSNIDNYEVDKNTLELYYRVSNKMRFKIAQIDYESYFTDIKGTEWELDMADMFESQEELEEYEIYNLTLYHYNHRALKSKFVVEGTNKLKKLKSSEYIKDIIDRIERGEDEK